IESACEEYSQEVLGFSNVTTSGTPTPQNNLIVSATSPTLTPFGDSDFLLFEEADAFLAILNSEPSHPFHNQEQNLPLFKEELKAYEAQTIKSSVDEPPEVELKDLPHHLEYTFLEGDNKLPVIIAKELGSVEKSALIKVLKSHKLAIAWKLSDIQGTLPGNTITKPKEELKGITTRSGVAYQGPKTPSPSKQGTKVTKDQVQTPSSQNTAPVQPSVIQSESHSSVSKPVVAPVSTPMPNLKPFIPYPSRRDNEKRRDQANEQIKKLYEIFKEMSFEISFTDALILMPKFAFTLKALIGNKEKLSEMARTTMNEHCSAVILNKLPRKVGDPDKFLIPCEFPGMDECLALADLGASINLLPLSLWEGLSLPELTPTCMTLKLVDRLVSKPIGITKDVSFKVGVFHFPADFVVVDFEPDPRVPLILRRCFLMTSSTLIDVHKGELTLRIGNEAINYNLDQTVRYSANYNQMTVNKIDVIESACEEYSQEVLGFSNVTASGTLTPHNNLIVSATSPTLTPFGDSDFLLFEEADAFLGLEDNPDSLKINPFYYDLEGDILLLEAILNSKPSPPLPNQEQNLPSFKEELKAYEAQTVKSSVDEPPEVELKDLPHHLDANTASSSGSGTLTGNTVTNPKEELKCITTRSGVAYQGLKTPSPSKQETKVTKDQVQTPSSQNTAPVQPLVIQFESQALVSEPVVAPVSALMPNLKPSITYPSRRDNEKRREQANEQIEKFYEIFKEMSFEISFTDVLILRPKFASTLKALIGNKEKLSEMARTTMNEHCSAVILNKLPRKLGDPDECLALADLVSKPIGIAKDVPFKVGVFHFPADFVVVDFEPDPRVPLILGRCFLKTSRALIDVHKGELTLRIGNKAITYNLDQTVRYSANYIQMTTNKIDVVKEYSQEVLGFSNVTASGTPTPQNDPIISATSHTLTPFGDSDFLLFDPWVSPVHCVPKKGSFTVVENEENELIPTRLVTGWRVCIDYRKLNEATQKDHFHLPFMDQMLERLAGNEYYCFLDGFFGYFQIPINPRDKKRQRSPAHMARLPTVACLSACAMLQALFKGVLDTKGAENLAAGHLSRLENPYENVLDPKEIIETFPLETLSMVTFRGDSNAPWKLSTFSKLATMDPRGDIMVQTSLPKRSLMPVSSGLPFKKMPTSLLKIVTRANDKGKFHNRKRCLRIPSKLVKSLMFGALILWAYSRLH
nr:reverse transcriptase domain-containing protein [Tanacetum cinerariifolium]